MKRWEEPGAWPGFVAFMRSTPSADHLGWGPLTRRLAQAVASAWYGLRSSDGRLPHNRPFAHPAKFPAYKGWVGVMVSAACVRVRRAAGAGLE